MRNKQFLRNGPIGIRLCGEESQWFIMHCPVQRYHSQPALKPSTQCLLNHEILTTWSLISLVFHPVKSWKRVPLSASFNPCLLFLASTLRGSLMSTRYKSWKDKGWWRAPTLQPPFRRLHHVPHQHLGQLGPPHASLSFCHRCLRCRRWPAGKDATCSLMSFFGWNWGKCSLPC